MESTGGELSVEQLVTLLKNEVWSLSAFGATYKSTLIHLDSELRFTVNAIQPVNRLPPEVLTEIFAFLHPRIFRRYLPLIQATHVCRHWRNVISSTPSNWTWINFKWAGLAPLLLRLSGSALIDVKIPNLEGFRTTFVLDLLLPCCERVSTLILAFSGAHRGYCYQIISKLRWMPNLRLLSIPAERELSPRSLPILSGDMPHLESITVPFFPYGPLSKLTHLMSINITVDRSPLTDVIGLFVNNPKLKRATLCGTFSDESCQLRRGAIRMDSLRQLDLLSWGATSLLPFLTLKVHAHIRVFGPSYSLGMVGAGDLFPSDTTFLPNLIGLKKLCWYPVGNDIFMELTGPNGGFSALLPWSEPHAPTIDSLPLGEVEELHCESTGTTSPVITAYELNRMIDSIPTMRQLRKITFAMCTNSFIQAVLTNLNRATHLKSITLSHCDNPDPNHDVSRAVFLFAKRRESANSKLEEVRVICRASARRMEFLDRSLSQVVKSFVVVHQSTRRTDIEVRRKFPASIQKTYPPYP